MIAVFEKSGDVVYVGETPYSQVWNLTETESIQTDVCSVLTESRGPGWLRAALPESAVLAPRPLREG